MDIPGESTPQVVQNEQELDPIVLAIDFADCPVVEPPPEPGLPVGCSVRINDEHLPVSELAGKVEEVFATRVMADRVLFLAAHGGLNYEAVMRIVDTAKSRVEGLRIGMTGSELR